MDTTYVTGVPSSGNNGQHTTSISVIQDDDISSLSVVPGRPPAGYQDDNRPTTIGYQPDSIPVAKPTLTGDKQGMEADITPQLSNWQGQLRRVKENVTMNDMNKESCSHDKEGTCAIHGKGAKKVIEPIWITKVGADVSKTKVKKKKYLWRCNVLSMRTEQGLRQTKISFLKKTPSKKAEGGHDTEGQLVAGPPDMLARASSSSHFENSTGQLSSYVKPGSDARLV